MRFTVITPSFRNSEWLKLCVASVADQGVPTQHIVQDCGSDDGTLEWLTRDRRVEAFVEEDRGMYDAINRGLRRATGEVLAYLNCDEQYLPGALAAVGSCFEQHPEVEVVFADTVVVDARGGYLRSRQASLPRKYHTWISDTLSVTSSAMFFRRSIIERRKLFFEDGLRDLGDVVWVLQLIKSGVPMGLLGEFTSVFTETGRNMGRNPNVQRERAALVAGAPGWARWVRPFIVFRYRLHRLLSGHYSRQPFSYALYTKESPNARVTMQTRSPAGSPR